MKNLKQIIGDSDEEEEEATDEEPKTEDTNSPVILDSGAKLAFKTFDHPTTVKVGHFMALRCGHNGSFLSSERKVYEKHLFRAGLITKHH